MHRILLASHDTRLIGWLEPSLQAVDADVLMAGSGDELERTLFHGGPFDLVVASVQASGTSGLLVLVKARAHGIHTVPSVRARSSVRLDPATAHSRTRTASRSYTVGRSRQPSGG